MTWTKNGVIAAGMSRQYRHFYILPGRTLGQPVVREVTALCGYTRMWNGDEDWKTLVQNPPHDERCPKCEKAREWSWLA